MSASEVAELKRTLGEYQYIDVDPQLTFEFRETEFTSKKSAYEDIDVTFNLKVTQHNKDFPVDKYQLILNISVLDENENEVYDFSEVLNVDAEVSTIQQTQKLFNFEGIYALGHKLVVEKYNWYPIRDFKAYK